MVHSETADTTRPSLQIAVERARAEFLEMPGLRLTAAQARRLWTLEAGVCDAVLDALLAARFLKRTAGDAYIRNEP
jgi:hypothetical protein